MIRANPIRKKAKHPKTAKIKRRMAKTHNKKKSETIISSI